MKTRALILATAASLMLASGAQAVPLTFSPVTGEVVGTFLGLHCFAFRFDGDDKYYGFPRVSLGPPVNEITAGTPINEDAVTEIDSAFNNHTMISVLAVESTPGVAVPVPYCSAIPAAVQLIQGIRKGTLRP